MEKVVIVKELVKGFVSELDILEDYIDSKRIFVEEVDESKYLFRFVSYKNDYRLTNFFREVIDKNSLSFEDVIKVNYRQSKALVGEVVFDGDIISVNGDKSVFEEININNGEVTDRSETGSESFKFLYGVTRDNNNFRITDALVNNNVKSLVKDINNN